MGQFTRMGSHSPRWPLVSGFLPGQVFPRLSLAAVCARTPFLRVPGDVLLCRHAPRAPPQLGDLAGRHVGGCVRPSCLDRAPLVLGVHLGRTARPDADSLSSVAAPFGTPTGSGAGGLVPPPPHPHSFLFVVLTTAVLVGVRGTPAVAAMGASLRAGDAEPRSRTCGPPVPLLWRCVYSDPMPI